MEWGDSLVWSVFNQFLLNLYIIAPSSFIFDRLTSRVLIWWYPHSCSQTHFDPFSHWPSSFAAFLSICLFVLNVFATSSEVRFWHNWDRRWALWLECYLWREWNGDFLTSFLSVIPTHWTAVTGLKNFHQPSVSKLLESLNQIASLSLHLCSFGVNSPQLISKVASYGHTGGWSISHSNVHLARLR